MEKELVNFVPEPAHDFIDVEDVVDGMLNLSNHSARGIYELGSGKQYTNKEVLDIVEEKTGKKANISKVKSMRDYDTPDWVSMNFRARGFGWLPKKSLETSIEEMVEDYVKRNPKKSS
jgi:nucleoside-diphosphate-sugar epimerase